MKQFVIPQFIDNESHILGPIVVRQFVIMLAAGFLIFLSYKLADTGLFIILTFIIVVVSGPLAFIKVNGRPFHFFLLNLLQTIQRPGLRVWKKQISTREIKEDLKAAEKEEDAPVLSVVRQAPVASSRLAELSLIVDTGGVYGGEKLVEENGKVSG